jgi:hypothetical protein
MITSCLCSAHSVLQLFPGSDWVAANAALAHYNMRNFDEAQALYEDLLARDPARLAVGVLARCCVTGVIRYSTAAADAA